VTGRVPGLIASSRTSFPLIPILSQTLYPGYLEIAFSTDNQLLRLELARLPSPRREDHARSRHTSLQDRNPAHRAHHGRRRLQRQGASRTRSGRPRPPALAGAEHTPQWQKVCLDDGAGVPGEQRPVQCQFCAHLPGRHCVVMSQRVCCVDENMADPDSRPPSSRNRRAEAESMTTHALATRHGHISRDIWPRSWLRTAPSSSRLAWAPLTSSPAFCDLATRW
jgi:hypothetical protein